METSIDRTSYETVVYFPSKTNEKLPLIERVTRHANCNSIACLCSIEVSFERNLTIVHCSHFYYSYYLVKPKK